jgi:hypothetical protein
MDVPNIRVTSTQFPFFNILVVYSGQTRESTILVLLR